MEKTRTKTKAMARAVVLWHEIIIGFSHYFSLTSITIPNSVTSIGGRAFAGWHLKTKGRFSDA